MVKVNLKYDPEKEKFNWRVVKAGTNDCVSVFGEAMAYETRTEALNAITKEGHELVTIGRCVDKKCKGYGKEFVDRGYGYPVCPVNKHSLSPRLMNPAYEGQYVKEEQIIHIGLPRTHKTVCGLKTTNQDVKVAFYKDVANCPECLVEAKKRRSE